MSFFLFLLSHRHIWKKCTVLQLNCNIDMYIYAKGNIQNLLSNQQFYTAFPKDVHILQSSGNCLLWCKFILSTVNFKRTLSSLKVLSGSPKPFHTKELHKRANNSPMRRFWGSAECQEPLGCHPHLGIISMGSGLRRIRSLEDSSI